MTQHETEQMETPWLIDERGYPRHGSLEQQALFLLNYAILAPSPHNAQPWKFAVREGQVDFRIDLARGLPVADPDQREVYISLGCALENFLIAGRHFGMESDVDHFPDEGDQALAARVRLRPGQGPMPGDQMLFETMVNRQTSRREYLARPIPDDILAELRACVASYGLTLELADDLAARQTVSRLAVVADALQFGDAAFRRELSEGPGQGGYEPHVLLAKLGRLSQAFLNHCQPVVTPEADPAVAAPLLGFILAGSQEHRTHIKVGRAFERIWLTATAHDISLQPMTQILQLPQLEADLTRVLSLSGGIVQQLFRLGYATGTEAEFAPRHPLESFLR